MVLLISTDSFSKDQTEDSVELIEGYKIDLNNDDMLDEVLLIEDEDKIHLQLLVKTKDEYCLMLVTTGKREITLSCKPGLFVRGIKAGQADKDAKVYKTPGAYVKLTQKKGDSVAYFWNGDGFTEVWTDD